MRMTAGMLVALLAGCGGGELLDCAPGASRAADGVTCEGGGDTYVFAETADTAGDTTSSYDTATSSDTGDTGATDTDTVPSETADTSVDTGTPPTDTSGASDTSDTSDTAP